MTLTPVKFTSAKQVLEEMSFSRNKQQQPASTANANPPVAPDSSPPKHYNKDEEGDGTGDNHQVNDPLIPPSSYQHGTTGSSSRAAALPTIRNYYDDVNGGDDDPRTFFVVRGDASLRPNTGQTNSYDTAIFGLALHELLEQIRLANIICAVVCILLLLVSWMWRLVTGQIARLVLSCYLAFLSSVLLLVELTGIWNVASVDIFLKQNFGLLRHPVGRAIYIFLLSTLCFAIGGWFYFVIGVLYLAAAGVLMYAWFLYPELRRPFEVDDDDNDEVDRDSSRESVSWSAYASTFSTIVKTSSETASLLGASAVRK